MYFFKEASYGDIFPLRTPLTDDMRVAINQSKFDQVQGPQWVDYKGGYALEFITGFDKTTKFNIQVEHMWKEGTILSPHVHWVGSNTLAGDVKWEFTYSWANIGAAFPTETALTIVAANDTGTLDKHRRDYFSTISGTGKTISSMLICSLSRLGSDIDDTYLGSAYVLEFDIHIFRDKLGKNY